jgi:hypothetical protein
LFASFSALRSITTYFNIKCATADRSETIQVSDTNHSHYPKWTAVLTAETCTREEGKILKMYARGQTILSGAHKIDARTRKTL